MTISTDQEFDQALEQLARMYRALTAIKREVLPVSEQRFAMLAEGPLDEIRRLEDAINAYSGKSAALLIHATGTNS